MWLQVGQLPIKAGWQDVPLAFRSLAEAFKNNINLDSLLLLFDDLWKMKAQHLLTSRNISYFHIKNVETSWIFFIMKLCAWACTSAKIIFI